MTPWQIGGIVFGMAAYVAAWGWGGRPERLAVGVMLVVVLVSSSTYTWQVDGFRLASMALDLARFLVFGWMCFRFDRWWLFPVTAALALTVFLHGARLLDPTLTQYALASAHVGLGYLIDLALLLSVWERWLAGERAAGPVAWAKAARTTGARRPPM